MLLKLSLLQLDTHLSTHLNIVSYKIDDADGLDRGLFRNLFDREDDSYLLRSS
jgi:hypothetical protein